MQSLEPTGTRLLLLIKGIMQTGPNVLAESGGCPLFTLHACRCPPSSWKLLRNNLVIKNMGYILAAAKAICNTRFPPSVKLGSHVRRSPRPHFIDIPLWVCKKKKKRTRKRQPDAPTLLCSCVGTQACFLGGLACVLGLSWECFCFVKLIHTPGPWSAGWQHHLPGLKDGKRQRNDVVMKLIPCWQPLSIVLEGVAWVL